MIDEKKTIIEYEGDGKDIVGRTYMFRTGSIYNDSCEIVEEMIFEVYEVAGWQGQEPLYETSLGNLPDFATSKILLMGRIRKDGKSTVGFTEEMGFTNRVDALVFCGLIEELYDLATEYMPESRDLIVPLKKLENIKHVN